MRIKVPYALTVSFTQIVYKENGYSNANNYFYSSLKNQEKRKEKFFGKIN